VDKNIDIAVCYHKPSKIFQSDALKPMQLGKSTAKFDLGFRGDDTGDNISDKNKYYGEYTALYWLWKNSKADIKGSMHYRILFDLTSIDRKNKGVVLEDIKSPERFVFDLGLHEKNISKIMENADVIITKGHEDNRFNIEEQYKASHIPEYLNYTMEIIKHDFPDIYPAAMRILAGNTGWFKNLVIMKSEFFDAFCEFKFGVFKKLEKMVDVNRPEIAGGWRYTARYAAFIGERMTMFYVEYLRERGVKIIEFPIVRIAPRGTGIDDIKNFAFDAYSEDKTKNIIEPVFGVDAVAAMMATNNKYAPYCGVMLQSIIDNASPDKNYDIVIAGGKVSDKNKKLLESMAKPNISVRVIDIDVYMNDIDLNILYTRAWFTIEMYYRFFIPKLFAKYEKILYLDCDMVANRDIAKLYAIDIGDNWWGVTREKVISVMGFTEYTFEKKVFLPYIKKTLKMDSVFDYFQTGVMVWNVKKTIKDDVMNKCLAKLKEIKKPFYPDQCVMNSVANGKNIFWLPQNWNVNWCVPFHWSAGKNEAAYDNAMRLLEDPLILHYNSSSKPWNEPKLPNAHFFWQYARKTPFYEIILAGEGLPHKEKKRLKRAKWKMKKYNILQILTFGAIKSFRRKKKRYRDEVERIEEMYR